MLAGIPPGSRDVAIALPEVMRIGAKLALALIALPLVLFWLLYGFSYFTSTTFTNTFFLSLVPMFILLVVGHELLHAVGWMLAGRFSWRHIAFGLDRRTLSPYAHARVAMPVSAYRVGVVLPGIITGLLPVVIGLLARSGPLTLWGAFMLSSAVGDLIVLWVIRALPGTARVIDHPSKAGCIVLPD